MKIFNKKWNENNFFKIRETVLNSWPTGKGIDLNESVTYLKNLKSNKFCSNILSEEKQIPLIQPRGGVATIEEQIFLLETFTDTGADIMPVTIDSYTRQNEYYKSERGLSESLVKNKSMLNGFPAINHGVKECRRINDRISTPIQARHGSPDGRLLAEVAFASGWTSNEGGGISYNIPYSKKISIEESIFNWQYCDRLTGIYEEMGISMNREQFGPLTGTMIPPCISNSIAIIEGLLAAEQGVKNISLVYGSSGQVAQDIAAINSLRSLAEKKFKEFGYEIDLSIVFHQWMGNFPKEEARAYSIINLGSIAATLSKADKVIIKSPQEALRIPTVEANVSAIKTTDHMMKLIKSQYVSLELDTIDEQKFITEETECILVKVFELGRGDLVQGVIESFNKGVLDVPFSPSIFNNGKVVPMRDREGAIRIFEFGNLPFSQEIKNFHLKKINERIKFEKRLPGYDMLVDDIYSMTKGSFSE